MADKNIENEIKKRRTFAIISHPDAGKTTLTEKFLLFGGAINTAGSVKGKANSKYAVGWILRRREVYQLPHPFFSLIMKATVSIFLIHRDIRISQKTHIEP